MVVVQSEVGSSAPLPLAGGEGEGWCQNQKSFKFRREANYVPTPSLSRKREGCSNDRLGLFYSVVGYNLILPH